MSTNIVMSRKSNWLLPLLKSWEISFASWMVSLLFGKTCKKWDIATTLNSLVILNQLLIYLMHLKTSQYAIYNIILELKFMSTNMSLFEEYTVRPEDKPILKISADNHGINRAFLWKNLEFITNYSNSLHLLLNLQ